MREQNHNKRRRQLLKAIGGMAIAAAARPGLAFADVGQVQRRIPVSGEAISAIGMGTWITFNTPPFTQARRDRVQVLEAFFANGGMLVDSSPMYGFAESTIGFALEEIGPTPSLFSATKVWTPMRLAGLAQMKASLGLWGTQSFDLMQVHNMVDWKTHLPTLLDMKEREVIRYIGITTSHGRRHAPFLDVIETRAEFDFVQFTYNIGNREAERRLLPAALDRGKAVIINRPFAGGELFEKTRGTTLPAWAKDIDCENWAQYFLKFVISHPAVTCAIPATSRVPHMLENMGALRGELPDASLRRRMSDHFENI